MGSSSGTHSRAVGLIRLTTLANSIIKRQYITVRGLVQGVGFRPFVFRLAQSSHLAGFVLNDGEGVTIEVEGLPAHLASFRKRLADEAPSLSSIVSMEVTEIPVKGDSGFTIQHTDRSSTARTLISPDMGVCDDCLSELFDPADRRYLYPFINCTNCGPRYTIVESIPYDRSFTSMKVFPMCPVCEAEYSDPYHRRFHAQPNACPVCGPTVTLMDSDGTNLQSLNPVADAVSMLKDGKIAAIRGLGGFHLVVDARNESAIHELRLRKGRVGKPFALMAPDSEAVGRFCLVSEEEKIQLNQQTRPIVLLRSKPATGLAPGIAPGSRYLGFMLPYTPLHHVLLRGHFDALVMTSGNYSEEPIATGNDEAADRLAGMADFFLWHDRDILQRNDDSIVFVAAGSSRMVRRARGYVPSPVFLSEPVPQTLLATGGELKSTIALARDDQVFLSQHIGDLDNPAAFRFFEDTIEHLGKILEIEPQSIVYDLHPEYLSTKWAKRQTGTPAIGVQHHHAHMASVMAENGHKEPVIGLILDGTGYGLDGTIWGGEVLVGDCADFERYAWLRPVALPGGEKAVKQPWRTALSSVYSEYGASCLELDLPSLNQIPSETSRIIFQMIDKKINSPLSSGAGRLFDAVAALIGLSREISYEAEAAILLENVADPDVDGLLPGVEVKCSPGEMRTGDLIRSVVNCFLTDVPIPEIAARFHHTLAEKFVGAAVSARESLGIETVALSGGVFQNRMLLESMIERLQQKRFSVLTHRSVPCGDGGLALGQIAVAATRLARSKTEQFVISTNYSG